MTRQERIACLGAVALVFAARLSSAQIVLAGAAVSRDVQRFPGEPAQNRLEGSARGWTVTGGVTLRHLALRLEQSSTRPIANDQLFTVDIDGRSAAIQSTLTHRTRATMALGGFTHTISPRVRMTYLGGISFTHIERTFTTNAAPLVLVPPSVSNTAVTTVTDDVRPLAVGADGAVRIVAHVSLMAGIRWQRFRLSGDIDGSSTRPMVGALWTF